MPIGRTDEPLTTSAEIRNYRAKRMARLIRKVHLVDPRDPEDDDLATYIARCLASHETDTLKLVLDEYGAGAKR